MSFDWQKILESKRALRRKLAALPVAEKLRMLDDLRQRTLDIRGSTIRQGHGALHEKPAPYRSKPQLP
jgi:hypothetical protein